MQGTEVQIGLMEPDHGASREHRPMVGLDRGEAEVPIQMLESRGGPGEILPPPVPELILSQAIGPSFTFRCDLGTGPFSGESLPGGFIVIPPNARTWCRIEGEHRLRFLGVPPSVANRLMGRPENTPLDFGGLHTRQIQDPLIAHLMEAMWQEITRADPAAERFLEMALTTLLLRLQRLAEDACEPETRLKGLTRHQSALVIDHMRKALDQPLSLSRLAALVDLSPWHFARAFRQTHGLPPHEYLTRLRLEKAREMLRHTDFPISEIAQATGCSPQHLARRFRRHLGCSPSDYRRSDRSRRSDPN